MSYTTQKIKWLARQILPPFVLNAFQAKSYTFRGAYEKLEDVPKSSGYYNDKSYLELREEINRLVSKHSGKICQLPSSNPRSQISNLLPLLLALLSKKDLRVLDYGGGAGQTFLECCEIINTESIQYYIYDLGEVTQIGKECIRGSQYESQVHFIDKIDNLSFIDVVYMGSVLQYLDDYRYILKKIANLKPKYILMTDHFMGDAKTYATAQVNMNEKIIPYWIIELGEIIEILKSEGYTTIYRSANHQPYHTFDCVNEAYVVKDSCNLLFYRDINVAEESQSQ